MVNWAGLGSEGAMGTARGKCALLLLWLVWLAVVVVPWGLELNNIATASNSIMFAPWSTLSVLGFLDAQLSELSALSASEESAADRLRAEKLATGACWRFTAKNSAGVMYVLAAVDGDAGSGAVGRVGLLLAGGLAVGNSASVLRWVAVDKATALAAARAAAVSVADGGGAREGKRPASWMFGKRRGATGHRKFR